MKNLNLLLLLLFHSSSVALHAQTNFYTQSINKPQVNLRGGAILLGEIAVDFVAAGYVVVHFDGECYASVGDLIVLAASNNGNWTPNDGNVSIETSQPGFGRPFSHTRVYPVTAGHQRFYAVGQNFVELDGSGIATIYGTLSVEYFPDTGTAVVKSSGFVFNGDVTNTTAMTQQTLHTNGPGKMVVRFDGWITSDPGDRIVLAASNTMNWSFNDGNVSVEAVNDGDVDENSFSHTRVYTIPSAGDYTYYALAQNYGKKAGNGMIWVYGNLLAEFYPASGPEIILFDGFTLPDFDLNGQSTTITSIDLNAPEAGKVLVVLDGYLTASPGYDIVLAASNNGEWTENEGSVILQALDLDQNRYSFSHTRLYNISAGNHTYYAAGEIIGGSGTETADLFGALTVKYIPSSATPVFDVSAGQNTFDLYPNPASDIVYVQFREPEYVKGAIEILNVNGSVIRTYPYDTRGTVKLELSGLPSSMYWVKVDDVLKPLLRM